MQVRLVDVHPLHVPREPEAEQGSAGQSREGQSNGFRLFGFGLCGRSRVEILRHAPCGGGREGGGGGEGAADDRAGGEGGCEIRWLARDSGSPGLLAACLSLLGPVPPGGLACGSA